MLKLNNDDMT